MASARYPEFRKGRASNRNFFGFSGRAWKHTPRDFSVELGETLFGRFRMSSDLFFRVLTESSEKLRLVVPVYSLICSDTYMSWLGEQLGDPFRKWVILNFQIEKLNLIKLNAHLPANYLFGQFYNGILW